MHSFLVEAVALKWKEVIDLAGGPQSDVINVHICHSKATAIARRALEQLEPEYRPHIHVLAIGGPVAIPSRLAGYVHNVWRAGDPVAGCRDLKKYWKVRNGKNVPGYNISLVGDDGCPVNINSGERTSSFLPDIKKHFWKGNEVHETTVEGFLCMYFWNSWQI